LPRLWAKKYKVYFSEVGGSALKGKKYDFLTMNHVLEHVEKPENFVFELNKLLKKDGYLIFAVPYLKGLVPNVLRTKWYGLGSGQHLNFFSKNSMRLLLEKNGFDVQEFKVLSVDYAHPKFPRVVNMIAEVIMKFIVSFRLGDNLFTVAKKVREAK